MELHPISPAVQSQPSDLAPDPLSESWVHPLPETSSAPKIPMEQAVEQLIEQLMQPFMQEPAAPVAVMQPPVEPPGATSPSVKPTPEIAKRTSEPIASVIAEDGAVSALSDVQQQNHQKLMQRLRSLSPEQLQMLDIDSAWLA
jgi:hypothetical protein